MKLVRNLFTKNIFWKILALFFALILWFVGISINDPPITERIDDIPLTIINDNILASRNFVLLNSDNLKDTTISVSVRGSRSDIETLRNRRSQIIAYIDLKPVDITYEKDLGIPIAVTVNVDLPSFRSTSKSIELTLINNKPASVDVEIDKIISRKFNIFATTTGETKENFIAMTAEASPKDIEIAGAETFINRIDEVRVTTDIKGASKDVASTEQLLILDEDKNDITGLFVLGSRNVDITVPIKMTQKIKINSNFTGNLEAGHVLTNVNLEPEYVEVVGSEEEILNAKPIQLPAENIENVSSDFSFTKDLRPLLVDTNLSIRNGTPNEVKVNVEIARQIRKDFTIPGDSLNIVGFSNTVEIPKEDIKFSVLAIEEKLNDLKAEDITATLNLSELDVGTHDIEVSFELPEGVEIFGNNPIVEVIISRIE